MFSFFGNTSAADLYVDLGTANILIAGRGQGVLINEPTLLAYTETSPGKRRVIAVGKEAKEKLTHTPGNLIANRPLKDGVIADFELTEIMLNYFLSRKELKKFNRPRIVVSLPYGVTEVEKRAVIEAGLNAGAKHVYLIDEPMAAAIGSELPIEAAKGSMIIDIGGGTTEVAVIALSDIIYCQAVRMGGHRFDEAIVKYLKNKKQLIVTDQQAEQIKLSIGTATPKRDIQFLSAQGRHSETGLNVQVEVSSEDIGLALEDSLQEIIQAIHKALEETPPELVSDIIESGIVLAGGGALLKNIHLRIENEIRLPVRIAEEPLTAIAKGGMKVLESPELLEKIQIEI